MATEGGNRAPELIPKTYGAHMLIQFAGLRDLVRELSQLWPTMPVRLFSMCA